MRRRGPQLAALCAVLALAGCATRPPVDAGADAGATFILVRHAEKAADDPRDPTLSEAGVARAAALTRQLHGRPLDAVYATRFRRTQQTAAPVALDHGLPVTTYDADAPAAQVAAMLRGAHPHGTVLVVGHSNTVPAIAQALCGCAIGPTADNEFGRRITVEVRADGRVTADDRREP